MQLIQPNLEPHSLYYTCWVQVVYSLLPTLLFFLLGKLYCCSVPADARESQSTSLWRPTQLPTRVIVYVLRFLILCIRHFVINVINNIRIRFIISITWYVLWYTIHSIVYTCDWMLARIWLLGLCPFINRVLHFESGHVRYRKPSPPITSGGRIRPSLTRFLRIEPMFCLPWPIAIVSQLCSSYHGSFAPEWT